MRPTKPVMLASQKGLALLSVMLVVTIAIVLSAQLMRQTSAALNDAQQTAQLRQAFWYSRAGETFGRQILHEDFVQGTQARQATTDSFHDTWAESFRGFELEDGKLVIKVIDLRSRINLNAIQGQASTAAESALREVWLQHGLPTAQLDILLAYLQDHTFQDISELAGLLNINQQQLVALQSLLVALPDSQLAVNLNTAGEAVLQAVLPKESDSVVRKIIETRASEAFISVDQAPLSNYSSTSTTLDVKSEYFEVQAHAQFGNAHHYLRTRLHRNVDGELRILDRAEGKQFVRELLEHTQS